MDQQSVKSWTWRIANLPHVTTGFPVARKLPYSGYQYRVYESAYDFLLEASKEDLSLFVSEGRLKSSYHLFALDTQPCRYVQDVDIKEPLTSHQYERILQEVCVAVVQIFNRVFSPRVATVNENIRVADSCGSNIGSYHIILTGFCFLGMEAQKHMFDAICKALPGYGKYLDNTQSAHHLLRAVNCSKDGRYKTLRHDGRTEKTGLLGNRRLVYPTGASDPYEARLHLLAAELDATSFVASRTDILLDGRRHGTMKRKHTASMSTTYKADGHNIGELVTIFPQLSQYRVTKAEGNRIILTRKQEGSSPNPEQHCEQCCCTHSSDNAYIEVLGKDQYSFHCWRGVKNRIAPIVIRIPKGTPEPENST